jgi:hypothetical protein
VTNERYAGVPTEVRIILRHPVLRNSGSKYQQLIDPVWLWFRYPRFEFAAAMRQTSEPPLCSVYHSPTEGTLKLLARFLDCTSEDWAPMRSRVRQELKKALLIAAGFGLLCFGAAVVATSLVGRS